MKQKRLTELNVSIKGENAIRIIHAKWQKGIVIMLLFFSFLFSLSLIISLSLLLPELPFFLLSFLRLVHLFFINFVLCFFSSLFSLDLVFFHFCLYLFMSFLFLLDLCVSSSSFSWLSPFLYCCIRPRVIIISYYSLPSFFHSSSSSAFPPRPPLLLLLPRLPALTFRTLVPDTCFGTWGVTP